MGSRRGVLGLAAWLIFVGSACEPASVNWTHWGGDESSARYAAVSQIDAQNFEQLEVAWKWRSADVELRERLVEEKRIPANRLTIQDFVGTPLAVDGTLYGITSLSQVYALDAATGESKWLHDPEAWRIEKPSMRYPKHRGLAFYRDQDDRADTRIYAATLDAWLIALDAATGAPIAGFGTDGRVDLVASLRAHQPLRRGHDYWQASPPAVFEDLIIVGGTVTDRLEGMRGTPGDLRAYDANTGELRWTFHTIPKRDDPAWASWKMRSASYTGAANVWAAMSVDHELGLVYAATSTPTSDHYGGHRPGDNEYAETLLCLNARTGERVWHQQLVRHGVWDYDIAAAPNLIDITVDGRAIKAVAQATKQAMLFVFDRETGEPVWPIEDRPVPHSSVPGERSAATQRFPTKPPAYDRQGTRVEDLIDFSPELRERAKALFDKYESGPLFTPPSLKGALSLPGGNGGSNWQGAGVDPRTGVVYIPSVTLPTVFRLAKGDRSKTNLRFVPAFAAPPVLPENARFGLGVPIFKPPWSRITAIDLNQGSIRWQVPNGEGRRDLALFEGLDVPSLGSGAPTCVIVTDSLLIAPDGAGPWLTPVGRPILRAFDKATGEIVGAIEIPGRVRGCPMTYAHNDVQYIVLPLLPDPDPVVVALALPESHR